jgi:integrating conjugative element protein (TIGR03765 family)
VCGVVARKWRWLALAITVLPAMASAELVVIYDSGNTRPLAPLLEVFGEGPPPAAEHSAPPEPQLGAADVAQLLPIRSPGLSPGRVARRAGGRPFARPFFLVGSDPMSRQWLATHRDRLVEIGAVGMLVQAEGVDDLRTIATLAHGLPILPASASDIAEALGLSHYPVLITKDGLEQ